jgi:hypothetical protein
MIPNCWRFPLSQSGKWYFLLAAVESVTSEAYFRISAQQIGRSDGFKDLAGYLSDMLAWKPYLRKCSNLADGCAHTVSRRFTVKVSFRWDAHIWQVVSRGSLCAYSRYTYSILKHLPLEISVYDQEHC